LFPNDDPANRDRDSAEMLAIALEKVAAAGFDVVNIDCIVQTERPKIGPHKEMIRYRLAELLKVDVDCVGLKAKTGEGVGPVGRGEAIEARCVVLLAKS
jgi:2-C-methyl-D-erythritol 2,4-cyclodiphosphate synthase